VGFAGGWGEVAELGGRLREGRRRPVGFAGGRREVPELGWRLREGRRRLRFASGRPKMALVRWRPALRFADGRPELNCADWRRSNGRSWSRHVRRHDVGLSEGGRSYLSRPSGR
jgi:hypothetical protein